MAKKKSTTTTTNTSDSVITPTAVTDISTPSTDTTSTPPISMLIPGNSSIFSVKAAVDQHEGNEGDTSPVSILSSPNGVSSVGIIAGASAGVIAGAVVSSTHIHTQLHPDEIDADSENNACRPFGFDSDSVAGLAISMSDPNGSGQLQNITVGPKNNDTGKYPLSTGFRRHAAATEVMNRQLSAGMLRELCIKLDVVIITNYTPLTALDANITENMQRSTLTCVEIANAIAEYKKAHGYDDSLKSMELIGNFFGMERGSIVQYYKVHTSFSNAEKRKLHNDAVKHDPILLLAKMTPDNRAKLIDQLDTESYEIEVAAVQAEEDALKAAKDLALSKLEEAKLALQEEEENEQALLDAEQERANSKIHKSVNGDDSKPATTKRVNTAPISQAVKNKRSAAEREEARAQAKAHTKRLEDAAKQKAEQARAARAATTGKNAPGKITGPNIIAAAAKLGITAPGKVLTMAQFKKSLEDLNSQDDKEKYNFELTRKQRNFVDRLLECCDGVRSQQDMYDFVRQYVDPQD